MISFHDFTTILEIMYGDLELLWKRPNSLSFPKIWRTFKSKGSVRDELVEFTIQDLPESCFKEAVEFMIDVFCSDEPLTESHGNTFMTNHIYCMESLN